MYIRIGEKVYNQISSLTFMPATDLTGTSIPVNEFQVDLNTEDAIAFKIGNYIELYDDNHNLWANYWIVYAENVRFDHVRIRAQSEISRLDRVNLPAVYYDAVPVKEVLDTVIVYKRSNIVSVLDYTLDSSFESVTITGFCPEQTARDRLLWICLILGAYVKTFFNRGIEILKIPSGIEYVSKSETYWRPQISSTDYVTAIKATAYQFETGEPYVTDQWVKDATGTVYVVASDEVILNNPNVPAGAPENVVSIDGVYLINNHNVGTILTRLAGMYFNRIVVDAEVIDNAKYIPGGSVMLHTDDRTLYSGAIESCNFSFGLQSKGKLRLVSAVEYGFSGMPFDDLILPPDKVWARFFDGMSLVYATTVTKGETPVYGGDTPTRGDDTFLGWSPAIGPIGESTSYFAQWRVNGSGSVNTSEDWETLPTMPEYEDIAPEDMPDDTVWAWFYDGATALGKVEVIPGDTPVYTGELPTHEGKTFGGWFPELGPITADAYYFAQWEYVDETTEETETEDSREEIPELPIMPEYEGIDPEDMPEDTVWAIFMDGTTTLGKVKVASGDTPVYTGTALTRHGYVFDGWSPELGPITTDTVYFAQWEASTDSFDEWPELPTMPEYEGIDPEDMPEETVWAMFMDGTTVLGKVEVIPGDTPVYTGEMPERDGDIFTGWNPPLTPIYADTIYYAQWENAGGSEDELPGTGGGTGGGTGEVPSGETETPYHWATFADGDVIYQKMSVKEGETPEYTGDTPTRDGNRFMGWSPEPGPIYFDTEYYAQWEYMSAYLVVKCMYGDTQLEQQEYFYPVGYQYSIDSEYLEIYMNDHHYIMRPTTAKVEGTMEEGENVVTVEYAVALDEYDGTLEVISVDSVSESGVIA